MEPEWNNSPEEDDCLLLGLREDQSTDKTENCDKV
jgi:hypothetical protein